MLAPCLVVVEICLKEHVLVEVHILLVKVRCTCKGSARTSFVVFRSIGLCDIHTKVEVCPERLKTMNLVVNLKVSYPTEGVAVVDVVIN